MKREESELRQSIESERNKAEGLEERKMLLQLKADCNEDEEAKLLEEL